MGVSHITWHHRLYGYDFEEALGVGDGQGSLVCCSPWGHKESNMSEPLNWLTVGCSVTDVFKIQNQNWDLHTKSIVHVIEMKKKVDL